MFEHWAFLIGVISNLLVLFGGLWRLNQVAHHVQKTFDFFAIEHELLIRDYCDRHGIESRELPTRLGHPPWWPGINKPSNYDR
jgi:hypothetical protein